MADNTKRDLLPEEADKLAEFFTKYATAMATGDYSEAQAAIELAEALLEPLSLQPTGDQLAEELAKKPPDIDVLMMLSEYGEMLASFQKEYYVINNRHARIGRAARSTAIMKHNGSEKGAVLKRIKTAGGAY